MTGRLGIDDVTPEVAGGRDPAKAVVGEHVPVTATVWREGSLSGESRRALLKLRSLGVTADEPLLGYAPRIRLRDAAFDPLDAAIRKAVRVRFSYLKPGEDSPRLRTVAPLALVQHQGRWHLYADEPESGLAKTFLLRRIVSPVELTSKTFVAPEGDQSAKALAGLDELWAHRVAVVEVEPGTDAAIRLTNRRGTSVLPDGALELHHTDADILADELASFGPEVLVVSPTELRDAVVARLTRTAADHG